jgi:hypothetical protein
MFYGTTMVRLTWKVRTPRTGWLDASGRALERETLVPSNQQTDLPQANGTVLFHFRVRSREIEWFRYQLQTIVKLFGTTRLGPRHLFA